MFQYECLERGGKGMSGIEEHDLRLLLESEMWNTEGTACPSFPIIVSKFAKDLLNELKPIRSGLNREITLQYVAAGSAMCYS